MINLNKPSKTITFFFTSFIIITSIIILILAFYFINTPNHSINVNPNEVPYISIYYLKPIVSTSEEVILDFYITDFYQTEYQKEDYSTKFTVKIKINGEKEIIKKNLKAGDNSISLGKFKKIGEQNFSILVTDEYGRNSHELFNYFLVRDDVEINEYIMTKKDLLTYNIKNIDTYEEKKFITLDIDNPTSELVRDAMIQESKKYTPSPNTYLCLIANVSNYDFNNWWGENIVIYDSSYSKEKVLQESTATREGLQKLINDKKSEGYNKVTLLPGIYRIDHLKQIYIPTEFTLNLNGSTIKQNQFAGSESLMIELNNTFDSHVINGTLEGDYYSHDYANSVEAPEHVNGISIGGASKYSSYENLIIKDITGYGATNGISKSEDGSLEFTYLPPIAVGDTFELGDIDRNTGEAISSTIRTTSDFINISTHSEVGYLSINRYLGYQGRAFDSWNLICHFYDENKNFIKSTDGYQYRRIEVPTSAKYIKITTLTTEKPTDLSVQYFRLPTNCSIKNIKFENCRSVGLAPMAMNNMLFENCQFINCGQALTNCAFDAEDGWDLMQDCTFRKLNFYDNPKVDWFAAAGHNFVIEDMIGGKVSFAPRSNSYVLRNCNSVTIANNGLGRDNRVSTGYTRIYNNIIDYSGNLFANDKNWPAIIKDCTINGTAEAFGEAKEYCIWLRCNIGESLDKSTNYTTAALPGIFIDCYIHDKYGYNLDGTYINCKLQNINGGFSGKLTIKNSEINNMNLNIIRSDVNEILLEDCKVTNFTFDGTADYLKNKGLIFTADNCEFNNESPLLKLQYYLTNKPIIINNSTFNSTSSSGLILFTGWSDNEVTKSDSEYDRTIEIINSTINLPNSNYIFESGNENNLASNNSLILTLKNTKYSKNIINIINPLIENSLNINLNN